jgi:hypothetical protein
MKVGDLVRYNSGPKEWTQWIGIVIRQIPGTDERQIVMWTQDNIRTSTPKRSLEVISESR